MDFTHSGQGFETICKELGIKILRIFLKCSYRQTFYPLDSLSVRTSFSSKMAGEAGLFASLTNLCNKVLLFVTTGEAILERYHLSSTVDVRHRASVLQRTNHRATHVS